MRVRLYRGEKGPPREKSRRSRLPVSRSRQLRLPWPIRWSREWKANHSHAESFSRTWRRRREHHATERRHWRQGPADLCGLRYQRARRQSELWGSRLSSLEQQIADSGWAGKVCRAVAFATRTSRPCDRFYQIRAEKRKSDGCASHRRIDARALRFRHG